MINIACAIFLCNKKMFIKKHIQHMCFLMNIIVLTLYYNTSALFCQQKLTIFLQLFFLTLHFVNFIMVLRTYTPCFLQHLPNMLHFLHTNHHCFLLFCFSSSAASPFRSAILCAISPYVMVLLYGIVKSISHTG